MGSFHVLGVHTYFLGTTLTKTMLRADFPLFKLSGLGAGLAQFKPQPSLERPSPAIFVSSVPLPATVCPRKRINGPLPYIYIGG